PHLVFHGVDGFDPGPGRLDTAVVGRTENLTGETAETDHPMVLSIAIWPFATGTWRAHQIRVNADKRKKRPENGSGRQVVGQIRGGSIDVNAALALWAAPNSATIRLIWNPSAHAILIGNPHWSYLDVPVIRRAS